MQEVELCQDDVKPQVTAASERLETIEAMLSKQNTNRDLLRQDSMEPITGEDSKKVPTTDEKPREIEERKDNRCLAVIAMNFFAIFWVLNGVLFKIVAK